MSVVYVVKEIIPIISFLNHNSIYHPVRDNNNLANTLYFCTTALYLAKIFMQSITT